LELMRVAGIEDRVRAAALALYSPDGGINAVESLAGREIANTIGREASSSFCADYGIGPSDASLVRPAGFVAWRATSRSPDAADRLVSALRTVLSRD
jgi:hypothetical protein